VHGPIDTGERLDHLFSMLMATIANVNRGRKQKAYTAEQFRPKWDPRARPTRRPAMTGEEMLRAAKRATRAMGG